MHYRQSGLLSEGRLRQYDKLHNADIAGVYCILCIVKFKMHYDTGAYVRPCLWVEDSIEIILKFS